MFYITGDTHGDFSRVEEFCEIYDTSKEDVMIVLGDAGINYHLDESDRKLKDRLEELPITFFCIHGNHEERPYEIDSYQEIEWMGGIVYVEEDYPSILFAKDGEIYNFNGKSVIAIGGAYSVDKYYRLANRLKWFDTEQPDESIKIFVESQLDKRGWEIDYVLSHTVPTSYEPTWAYLPNIDQSTVDKSTEEWLDTIEKRLSYEYWLAGHWHVEAQGGMVRIMYREIDELEGCNDD